MLLLLFEIGNGRYALDARRIIEVVPLVKLKKIPTTPDSVAGLMNYRGKGVPVIELNRLIDSAPSADAFSTRIIIISYPLEKTGEQLLALIADNVTKTVRSDMTRPPSTGILMDKSLYDGAALPETNDMIQWFDIRKMLPEKEIGLLFEAKE